MDGRDHSALSLFKPSTSDAQDRALGSRLITIKAVGVFSTARLKRNHQLN